MKTRWLFMAAVSMTALALWLQPRQAHAIVLDTSTTAFYSFDFAGTTAVPPFTRFLIQNFFGASDSWNFGETVEISAYDDLGSSPLGSRSATNGFGVVHELGFGLVLSTPLTDLTGFVSIHPLSGSFDLSAVDVGNTFNLDFHRLLLSSTLNLLESFPSRALLRFLRWHSGQWVSAAAGPSQTSALRA